MRMAAAKSHSSALSLLTVPSRSRPNSSLKQAAPAVTAMPSQITAITSTEIRSWRDRLGKSVGAKLSAVCGETSRVQDCCAAELWSRGINGAAATAEQLLQATVSASAELAPLFTSRHEEAPSTGSAPNQISPAGRSACAAPAAEQAVMQGLRQLGESLISRGNDEPSMALLLPSAQAREYANGNATPASAPACMSRTEMPPLNEQEMDFGEDLTELALRMKRVLDEEARRHGIDV